MTHPPSQARPRVRALMGCVLLMAAAAHTAQAASDQPLWEVGLGAAALHFPAYRGSDQGQGFVLPVPYLVYRGDFFKVDRDGVRAQLFDSDRMELTFSGALSPPAATRDVRARAGMPDLRASFELGPQLDITLWHPQKRGTTLKLLLPVRAAFTLEQRPQHLGWVFHPKLNVGVPHVAGLPGWNLGLQAGPLWGDRRQHNHFYGVAAPYATGERPAYAAGAGFAGMQYVVGVSKRYPSHWVGAFLRYDNLNGARFVNSPLVRTRHHVAAGVAVSWILGSSTTRVTVDD